MNQTIKLDAKKREGSFCKERIYPLRRGERNNVTLTVAVRRDRRPYDLAGMTAHLVWQAADGKLVGPVPMEVTDQAASAVRCTLPDACYAAVGTARAYIEIRNGAELVDTTDEMLINVLDCIDADAEQAEEYKPLIAEAREATDAAIKAAAKAVTDTQAAIAEVKATEAKLYPVAENTLKGTSKDTFVHVDDAFTSTLLGIEIEGATEQVTTTGANLFDIRKFIPNDSVYGLTVSVKEGFILVRGTVNGVGDIQSPSFNIGQYADNSLSGKQLNLKVFGEPSYFNRVYGLRTADEKNIAVVASFHDGYTIDWKLLLTVSASTLAKYEPYTGGKPSPSPDFPQEIKVIENPTVKVTGRNLWPFASSCTSIKGHQNEFVREGTPFTLFPGAYTFSATGSLGDADAPLFGYTATGKRFQLFRILHNAQNPKYSFTVTEPIASVYFVSNAAVSSTGTISNIQLERDSVATEYKPHTSQTLTFALPAEHPYLAKLPDGTADEIVVDRDGNVELVARVAKVIPKDVETIDFGAGTDTDVPYVSFRVSGITNKMGILCNSYQTSYWINKSGYIYCPNGLDIAIRDSRFTSKEKAIELLNGVVVYIAVEPTRYSLGKIEMPKAQDSIVNAWTDAEVTPSTGIGYVRDVNIVVANLESAIASITEG